MSTTRRIIVAILVVALTGVMFAGWQGARAWMAWNRIDRVQFNLEAAREVLPRPARDIADTPSPTPTVALVGYETVLVIGSDEQPENQPDRREGEFADAVMFYMFPDDGSSPLIVSFPRDLIVVNPCDGKETKLDRTLEGCGDAIGGEELVALAIEDFTGVGVDNFASMRFKAFKRMVDAVGGVEICVPHALREGATDLLPEGCSTVEGDLALKWLRSRKTQEFVDDEWRFVEGAGDAARVRRQQILVFAMLERLKMVKSPADLASLAEELGDSIVLDETLGLGDAVAMVWGLRAVSGGSIRTLTVPTEPTVLDDGSFAVRATRSFAELIQG